MFLLPFNITSHLGNLRFAHRERTVSFLPRESGNVFECARNPTRGVGFQFTHQFRKRLVLPQFCQDMDVIRGAIHNQGGTAFGANRTAEVFLNSRPNRRDHPWFAIFRRKDNVIQKIAIGGTHTERPFRRPLSGALSFSHDTPGVPLRSTPGFIPSHPSGAWIKIAFASASAFAPRPTLDWSELLSGCGSENDFRFRSRVQRQRRGGLKPRVQRSETRGQTMPITCRTPSRGDGATGWRRIGEYLEQPK